MRKGVVLPLLLSLLLQGRLAAEGAPDVVAQVLEGAERQVGVTVICDGSYRRLADPTGPSTTAASRTSRRSSRGTAPSCP